jgi:hypothetical protein
MDIPAATNVQHDCRRIYKIHKEDHEALGQAFHSQVSERQALQYGTSVETQQKITKNAFRTKQTFSRIRTVQQQNTRAAITYVEHTNDDNIDVECFDREAIDAACIQEGIQRYSQAQDTPFLTSPLLEDFGFLGKQTTIKAVLNGTYVCPPEVLDIYTKKQFTNYAGHS